MSELTSCIRREDGSCESYRPGHHTHDGVDGGWTTVTYVDSDRQVRLWHHTDLAGELAVRAPVRVHERYYVLGARFGWLNVVVEGGLGPVPDPADTAAWAPQVTAGVQDLSTGRALALDWPDPQGS